jgi:leucyl/phenylalanyl-tRNA--protein transferase
MIHLPLLDPDQPEQFPDPSSALIEPNGLLAFGGDLSPIRLLAAYRQGIFPWFSEAEPILWWSPDPRCVFRTWILSEMIDAYIGLHALGHAHSVEVWDGETLVGGIYGIAIGKLFCGESMFSRESGGSKLALVELARLLRERGFPLIDAQVANAHTLGMGALEISRARYLDQIAGLVDACDNQAQWNGASASV